MASDHLPLVADFALKLPRPVEALQEAAETPAP
jgi:hypothetical protein